MALIKKDVHFDEDILKEVEEIAKIKGQKRAAIIREAVYNYVENFKRGRKISGPKGSTRYRGFNDVEIP